MARDSQNIDKWYKEYLKGLKEPVGARGWQPDEAAQDWVNNAIEKIFGKGTARPEWISNVPTTGAGSRDMSRIASLMEATWIANNNQQRSVDSGAGWYQPNLTPEQVPQLALMGNPVYQLNQAIGWQPTYAPQYGTAEESLANLRSEQANQNLTKTGNYYEKDGVLYANEPLRRDLSTNLYYGENSGQLYGQRWNQDKGVYDYTYTGTERNKYGQPAGTSTFAKNASGGPKSARSSAQSITGTRPVPSKEELQSEVDKLQNSLNNYQFKPRKDFSFKGGAGSQKRYNNLKRRLGILKNTLSGWQPGVGTESAASGTGTGWSW